MTNDFYDRHEDGYVLASIRLGRGMSDSIDRAQEREQLDRDLALREQRQKSTTGCDHCEECGEPVSAVRQALGARLCVQHQEAVEAQERRRKARVAV